MPKAGRFGFCDDSFYLTECLLTAAEQFQKSFLFRFGS
jgi:hypothetical protein